MPGGADDDLARLAEVHTYSLQFTDPRGVLAPTLKDALGNTFDIFVGEPAAPRPAPERAAAKRRSRLLAKIDAEVARSGMAKEALIRQPEFAGPRGVFRPDRALRAGGGAIALHALSFATQPWRALKDAKVLAIDYEAPRPGRPISSARPLWNRSPAARAGVTGRCTSRRRAISRTRTAR